MEISEMMSWIGSVLAMAAVMQGFIPSEYRNYFSDGLIYLISPYTYFIVPEYEGTSTNDLYMAVQTYLSSLTRERARKSNLLMAKNAKNFTFSLTKNQRIRDTFENVGVEWMHFAEERKTSLWVGWDHNSDERRAFQVKMPRRQRDFILDSYFKYIVKEAKVLERSNRDLNLYSNRNNERNGSSGGWTKVPFKHPASFDTVAMPPEQKFNLLSDLDSFVHGEDFYKRVGKAWKRGYLLFGPPGTGKTSIIAAMANKLGYDVYDLELTEVKTNSDLRKLLLHTSNKAIIVIEDIDCSLDFSGQRKKKKKAAETESEGKKPNSEEEDKPSKVTLSGLLNFTDGLWSACGSERIFVFTTNHVKKLDAALLRPGRMDLHIHLGYCGYPAFKILVRNFLEINDHPRFPEVKEIIDSNFMSPAEIAEILTKDRSNPDLAIDLVIKALHDRKANPPKEDADDDEDEESEEVSSDKKATNDASPPSDVKTTEDTNASSEIKTTEDTNALKDAKTTTDDTNASKDAKTTTDDTNASKDDKTTADDTNASDGKTTEDTKTAQ
ncbi:unnamed protein product [Calypogeia fissa]